MVAFRFSSVYVAALLASLAGQVCGAAIVVDTNNVDQYTDAIGSGGPEVSLVPRAIPNDLGTKMEYTSIAKSGSYGGGFWYQQIYPSTATTVSHDDVYNAAKVSWNNAVTKAKAAKKPEAAIGCALFIPGKGWILDTSLKAVGVGTQSAQTCDVVTDFMHINWANCAEMNALAIMTKKGWAEPTSGALMACYGNYGNPDITPKWVKPCQEATSKDDGNVYPGCKETLKNNARWKHITVLPVPKEVSQG